MADPKPTISPVDAAAGHVTAHRNADIYFFAGSVERSLSYQFCGCLRKNAKRPNALLLLTTTGGSGDAAYQMARRLQVAYQKGTVAVHVSSFCKSAGTLLALGATSVIMSDVAELGPLDVQISKPDSLGERYPSGE